MTKETRGLLLEFLSKLDESREIGHLETSILDKVEKIITYAENYDIEKIKKEVVQIEDDFIEFKNLIKYQYFDYGISANEIEKNRRLDWQPKGFDEILNA